MASIIISSFSMIYVKDNDLLMPGWGSWVNNFSLIVSIATSILCTHLPVFHKM